MVAAAARGVVVQLSREQASPRVARDARPATGLGQNAGFAAVPPPVSPALDLDINRLADEGSPEEALARGRQALPGLDGEVQGRVLIAMSRAAVFVGRLQEALRLAAEAREIFQALGARSGVCDALIAMAAALRAGGDHVSALDTLEPAEALARELGEPLRIANVTRTVGVCSSIVCRHRHALSCLGEAVELVKAHGTPFDMHTATLSFYNAHNRYGQSLPRGSEQALAELEPFIARWQALADDCRAAGNRRVEVMALGNRAITLRDCGRAVEAVPLLLGLIPRYQSLGMQPNVAIAHNELGQCHEALGDAAAAREQFRLAIDLLRQDGSLDDLQIALEGLSRCEESLGQPAAALAALREVREVEARKRDEAARATVARRELRLELARLTSQWARQAMQDPLTGLGNRRAPERWLADRRPQVERGEPLSILLLDLDHFKQVNDRFGHDTGDAVLCRVAELMRRHCRSGDLAARYGGEEFLLALAGAPPQDAVQLAERLRAAVAAQDWPALQPGLQVTVSIGVTHASEAADNATLLTLADRRLYSAKIEGRDRVVATSP